MARLAPLAVAAACAALGAVAAAQQPCSASLDVQPSNIPIGLWYGGSVVHVKAEVPHGMPVALVFEGPSEHVTLHKKGKAGGILWMNVGDVELGGVPSAYLLSTSAPLPALGDPQTLETQQIGYAALGATVSGEREMFPELVKLKEQEGAYAVHEGALHLTPGQGGADSLVQDVPISPRIGEGQYQLRLVGFGNGQGRCLGSATLTLRQAGAAKSLRELAFGHGLLYGIAAVVIAIVAGLATGLLFGKGGSKGH